MTETPIKPILGPPPRPSPSPAPPPTKPHPGPHSPTDIITGQHPSTFDLTMSDDALITFTGPATPTAVGSAFALSFQDVGFMPINTLTIAGIPQDLKGKFDWLFIKYSGQGTQNFAGLNAPTTAEYSSLHYDLFGYKGNMIFGHAADGTPTISGGKHVTEIAQGDLIPGTGHLAFDPTTGGIAGDVSTTLEAHGQVTGMLDFSVMHAAGDINYLPTGTGFTLDGGILEATFHS